MAASAARPAGAQPTCTGQDLLPGLAKSNPELHASVLEAARTTPNGEALLWRISASKNAVPPSQDAGASTLVSETSWLFGTIHLTDPRVHALPPSVEEALQAAKTLALEIDDVSPKAIQRAFAENSELTRPRDDRKIGTGFSATDKRAFDTALPSIGTTSAQADSMRPWFLTTLLSRPTCEAARQNAGLQPLDAALRTRALARGARVVGLESIADQMRAMGSLPADAELAWLRASLRLYVRIDDVTETLVRLYLDRRISATWTLSQGLSGEAAMTPAQLDAIQQALVFRRNRQMRDAIVPLLRRGGTFVAVGALHLPGPDGLVQLLRERGFVLEPGD